MFTSLWARIEFMSLVIVGPDCIGRCKFNNHAVSHDSSLDKEINGCMFPKKF